MKRMSVNKYRIRSLIVVLLLIFVSLTPMVDNVSAELGSTDDPDTSYIPEDGIQDGEKDNGTIVKISNIAKIKDKIINLIHNTWSYNNTTTEVKINVTGDRVRILINNPDTGNVTLDMNFTYGKGKTFIKTKDKEKISYKTSDLNLSFGANTSAFKEIIVVEKEKDKLFPLNWTINVTSEMNMNISRINQTIYIEGMEVFDLQAFTATNVTNGTVALNETYSGGNSSFNISLDLGEVVDKDDYPLTIDPTVTIDVTGGFDLSNRNIAVNSSGVMYTAYYDGVRVEYQSSTDNGQSWGSATTVYTASDIKQVVMCIDTNDNLHFMWKEDTTKAIHISYWVGNSTWSSVFYVRDESGNWHDIVPDSLGNVYAFYTGPAGGLEWRIWDGDSWSAEGTIRADQGSPDEQHPEAAISSNGTIHITWQGTAASSPGIYYSRSTDGSTFSTPIQIDGDLGGAWQPSIAVDSNDDLHVVYMGKNATHTDMQIIYLKYDASGTSWSSEEYLTDLSTTKHRYPTISVDGADTVYSVWSNTGVAGGSNDQIDYRYSSDNGSTWSSVSTLIDRTYASRHPNLLHYAYPDGVGNVPEQGFMFSYNEDCTGTPDFTIYYSSNWSRVTDQNPLSISTEHPENNGFAPTQPWAHAFVAHLEGGQFNVTFSENSTGSWVDRQSNNTVTNGTFWWQFTQASNDETAYYWRVAAENGTDEINYTYKVTTAMLVNLTGDLITQCDLFRYVDGSIVDTYDLINDTSNYTVIFEPYRESSGWISNGGGSITKVGDTWYIVHRKRTGDTDRGHFLLLNSSTDLTTWPSVWNVSTNDVAPANPISFERASLRYYNNSYYLYFCTDLGGSWNSYYIKADTAANLEYSVKNSANWTLIDAGSKDPEVVFHNGTYYFIISDGLFKADNPEAVGKTFIVDFSQLYESKWGGACGNNTGTIMFDNTSGYFIYWRGARVDFDDDASINDIVWYFAVSGDMENWVAVDRHAKVKNYTETSGTLRYPAYFVTENETSCIMEWEDDIGSGNRSIVLWVYDEPASNNPPEFSSESPSNESIGISLQPWCSIQVNDTDNDTITINFYENSTGSWVYRQTNNSVVEAPDWSNNGTYWWQFTQASVQATQYWWNVTADDGTVNISTTYTFTTNEASAQSNPYPSNESTGISLQPWCNITVNDLEGDSMTIGWYENTTGPYVLRQTNSSASNGTYWWQYTQASVYSTLYYWRIDVLDGEFNTSVIYEFTTEDENFPPEFSDESPTNTTTGIALQPWCNITIEDSEGNTFNVTWEENSTGPWVIRQQNLSATNGTFWWQFTQASGRGVKYYWRLSADDGVNNTTIFEFTTQENNNPQVTSPYPTNSSSGISPYQEVYFTITDSDPVDLVNISWLENSTGIWVERTSWSNQQPKKFYWNFTQANLPLTMYYWRVNVTDGFNNTTAIYHYTTITSSAQISNEDPSNGTTIIVIQPTCGIDIQNPYGYSMNITWEENSTGSWVIRQINSSVGNGTYDWNFSQATTYGTTYYWRVSGDEGSTNITIIFKFTIQELVVPDIPEDAVTHLTTFIMALFVFLIIIIVLLKIIVMPMGRLLRRTL